MTVVRPLVIEVDRTEVAVGDTVTVRVKDSWNQPVEDALVRTQSKEKRTDEAGLCQFTLRAPGYWKIKAAKSPKKRTRFRSATGLLRAVPRAKSSRASRRIAPRSE